MAGEKLRQTIASAKFVVERLAPTDTLSVVQFDDKVKVVIPAGPVQNRPHLCRLLEGIRDGGSTNLSGGWLQGASCVRQQKTPETVNRVLLLTDGMANHGITDPEVLVKHAAELTEEGITTTTLGYGADFQEELLTALADAGRGAAYHVETADQAPTIFARELEGLLAVAAQNVRLSVRPHIAGSGVELLTDQECHKVGDGLTVVLGDLVSEEERTLLCRVRVPVLAGQSTALVASVTVTYDAVGDGIHSGAQTEELTLRFGSLDEVGATLPDAEVVKELLVFRAGRVLTQAIALADGGNVEGALKHLKDFLALPEVGSATDPEIRAVRRRVKDLLRQLEDDGFTRMNRKMMFYDSRTYSKSTRKSIKT